jgi:adenylosuccinate synthase
MAKSQATFMKKQLEKNRQKKKEDKLQRKEERKQNPGGSDLESMLAYVNEFQHHPKKNLINLQKTNKDNEALFETRRAFCLRVLQGYFYFDVPEHTLLIRIAV